MQTLRQITKSLLANLLQYGGPLNHKKLLAHNRGILRTQLNILKRFKFLLLEKKFHLTCLAGFLVGKCEKILSKKMLPLCDIKKNQRLPFDRVFFETATHNKPILLTTCLLVLLKKAKVKQHLIWSIFIT